MRHASNNCKMDGGGTSRRFHRSHHRPPHNSEYTPDHWKAREWLTGFDGSAGTAVVLAENGGALWTDSRYFLQAEEQLNGTPFELMRDGMPGTPSVAEWLRKNLPQGGNIGCYGEIMTQELADDLVGELGEEYQCVVTEKRPLQSHLDRPPSPCPTNRSKSCPTRQRDARRPTNCTASSKRNTNTVQKLNISCSTT